MSLLPHHNDDNSKEADNINQPRRPSLEPFTPEALVDDWEGLHHTRLPKQARDFALKVAVIHLDKDDDSRGVIVSDIKTLLGFKTINARQEKIGRLMRVYLWLIQHSNMANKRCTFYLIISML